MYQLDEDRMNLSILLIFNIFLILTMIFISSIKIYNENILGQMLNQTDFDKQLKMQEQELDQQLNETATSFNETEQLEGQAILFDKQTAVSNYQQNIKSTFNITRFFYFY